MEPGIGSFTWSDLGEELRVLGVPLQSLEVYYILNRFDDPETLGDSLKLPSYTLHFDIF